MRYRTATYASALATICSSIAIADDHASAQSIESVCMQLAQSGLVDSTNSSRAVSIVTDEYNFMCSNKEKRMERYNSSSVGAKAKYKVVSGSFSKSKSEITTQEDIDQLCEIGSSQFSQAISENFGQSIGSELADKVVECVRVAASAGQELVMGLVRVSQADDKFILDIYHSQGNPPEKYNIKSMIFDAKAEDIKCETNSTVGSASSDITSFTVQGHTAIACSKKPGVTVNGTLVLQPTVRLEDKSIRFEAISRNFENEVSVRILNEHRKIEEKYAGLLEAHSKADDLQRKADDVRFKRLETARLQCEVFRTQNTGAGHLVDVRSDVPRGFFVTGGGCDMIDVQNGRWTFLNAGQITNDQTGWYCRTEPIPNFALSRTVVARAIGCRWTLGTDTP